MTWTTTREAFEHAAEWFAATTAALDAVGPDAWHRPALGEWTRSDLVGHTARALLTVEQYLEDGTTTSTATTLDYYRTVRSSRADPAAVAERGRQAGRGLGADRITAVRAIVERVAGRVGSAPPDARVATPMGEWALAAYLPTRVFELTVHTIDLRVAAGLDADPPGAAAHEALRVLGLLVADADAEDATALLRALTGRAALPVGWSVL
ncbi:maleylpyruvate isomerase family mycothiol-dependent enzyme [Curtobacterium sp. B8]|uniref:maleylpyruvate isomerase family mycothiol-dependent enzyme n=1 Tax=Curtobacterium sp. B8 TaxID=95611 RepID=UPI0003B4D326|nr:maleylpyruvate isomerase N-terminal domain-containing protein [Curtobacterium sp. B8]